MSGRITLVLALLACLVFACKEINAQQTSDAVVTIDLGKIQGLVMESQRGKKFFAFLGIPYAKPPLAELRFKPPVPAEAWNQTLYAQSDGFMCPQNGDENQMSEDCLTLNVFSADLKGHAPVIVYIHGGANIMGSSNSEYQAGPQYLMDQDVVFVAFNYRLGALGFLSTGTPEAPGNYAYLDQVLALKWVQKYIANFGGDPNSVTIMGLSAGGMAVTLHLASPLSQGLFHKAIAMSGSATNHFAIDNLRWTRKLAREVSCPMYNPEDVVDCLRNISWNKIIEVCARWEPYNFQIMNWNYEIDGNFLTQNPNLSFMRDNFTKVPILASLTRDEFDYIGYHQKDNAGLLHDIDVSFDLYAPALFIYNATIDYSDPRKSDRIKEFYLGNQSISKENIHKCGQMFSDANIGHGVSRLVDLARRYGDVYYMRTDYEGAKSLYPIEGTKVIGHADDIQYVLSNSQMNDDDMFMVDRMTKWIATFAKDGVPQSENEVQWQASNASKIITLYNDKTTRLDEAPNKERYELWEKMFPVGDSGASHLKVTAFVVVMLGLLINLQ